MSPVEPAVVELLAHADGNREELSYALVACSHLSALLVHIAGRDVDGVRTILQESANTPDGLERLAHGLVAASSAADVIVPDPDEMRELAVLFARWETQL
ncbi:hypothetical protein ACFTWF_03205 [Rhodococcus sp. NPDC056960]|uniref:hypothetical protein n=1 Tax=Rhodococcus sp. NPDC056960 TaxID=3345982 RepID=UPI003644648A